MGAIGMGIDLSGRLEPPTSPMPIATTIDLERCVSMLYSIYIIIVIMSYIITYLSRHGLGNESLLSSITQRFSANVLHWCTYEWFYTTLDR